MGSTNRVVLGNYSFSHHARSISGSHLLEVDVQPGGIFTASSPRHLYMSLLAKCIAVQVDAIAPNKSVETRDSLRVSSLLLHAFEVCKKRLDR